MTTDATRPSPAPSRPTGRPIGLKTVAVLVVVVGLAVDLWSKAWMQERLGMRADAPDQSEVIVLVEGFFYLQGHWNPGITFGLLPHRTEAILAFTVLACVVLFGVILFTRSRSVLLYLSLALILGGALGNLYDRWQWQKVRDFLVVYYWPEKQWPAFNAADSFIVVGVILMLWRELFGRREAPVPEAAAGAGRAPAPGNAP